MKITKVTDKVGQYSAIGNQFLPLGEIGTFLCLMDIEKAEYEINDFYVIESVDSMTQEVMTPDAFKKIGGNTFIFENITFSIVNGSIILTNMENHADQLWLSMPSS